MIERWHRLGARIQRIFRLVVLFCVLRFIVGFAAIAIFDRDAIAWGPELTLVIIAMIAVYLGVALIVRHVSRPTSGL
ncbi:MAG: hypothetical protein M3P30_16495 [Chloroflexota bacterium]|nr:hypothetical protein [Chloroflexota bacterium]